MNNKKIKITGLFDATPSDSRTTQNHIISMIIFFFRQSDMKDIKFTFTSVNHLCILLADMKDKIIIVIDINVVYNTHCMNRINYYVGFTNRM